ncbi:MAG: O-succinylhomoserine sulfhydrylase, partial [Burkholderiales bacterium]
MTQQHWSDETLAVRSGTQRSAFGEHSEALYLTSSFVVDSAAQSAARLSSQAGGTGDSRFTNTPVSLV